MLMNSITSYLYVYSHIVEEILFMKHIKKRQGGKQVDHVINKLSEIEHDAASIMDAANTRKKEFADQIKKRTADFDEQLEKETAQKVADLRAKMEALMQTKLSKQKSDANEALKQMEANYETHHTFYVKELFQDMIKE